MTFEPLPEKLTYRAMIRIAREAKPPPDFEPIADDVAAGEVWPEEDPDACESCGAPYGPGLICRHALGCPELEPLQRPAATRRRRHDQERGMDPGLFC